MLFDKNNDEKMLLLPPHRQYLHLQLLPRLPQTVQDPPRTRMLLTSFPPALRTPDFPVSPYSPSWPTIHYNPLYVYNLNLLLLHYLLY